jgi:ATP-dependent DNA helicase RecG
MVVYHAERFGYAQLHQLRGRVGRGNKQGACLFMAKENDDRLERLKIFESTQDGFELSEIDLNRRGFGDIIGTKQSGLSALNLGKGNEDRVLFKETYEDAHKVLKMAKDNQCEKASKLIDILNENNDAVFD